jgi:NitT/TauT family transport system substrate-binding protein
MDEQRVAKTIEIMQSAGVIPAGLTPQKVADFSFVPKS